MSTTTDWQLVKELNAQIQRMRYEDDGPGTVLGELKAEREAQLAKGPAVGDLASFGYGSDCSPYEVIERTKSGATVTLRERRVEIVGGPYEYGDRPDYVTHPDPDGRTMVVTRRKNAGRSIYYPKGSSPSRRANGISFGHASYHRDPHR